MPETTTLLLPTQQSQSLSARTLVRIRWMVLTTQALGLLIATVGIHATIEAVPCIATIMAGIIFNMAAAFHRKRSPRLNAKIATLYLSFDILQMALLLHLTGGLDNPFALLLIAPAAVAASFLPFKSVASLTALTVFTLTTNAIWHLALPWPDGAIELPDRYAWAVWLALTMAIVFIAAYAWSVARETRRMQSALEAAQSELAKASQMTAMGALAAAVAHELGTPLATISLVSKELLNDIPADDQWLREDVELLVSQSERCRQVLADFARRPSAEGGDPYRVIPLVTLVEEAAEAHAQSRSGVGLTVAAGSGEGALPLMVRRRPELLHGLGNFIQNARQFANSMVDISIQNTEKQVLITIADDGVGFSSALLQKVGEPYISTREGGQGGHMGLGIFIAKILLERTGAKLTFGNRAGGGALITVTWPRSAAIFTPASSSGSKEGEN